MGIFGGNKELAGEDDTKSPSFISASFEYSNRVGWSPPVPTISPLILTLSTHTPNLLSGEVNNVTEEVNKEVLFTLPNNPPGPVTVLPISTPSFEPLFKIICLHQPPVFLEITAAVILSLLDDFKKLKRVVDTPDFIRNAIRD